MTIIVDIAKATAIREAIAIFLEAVERIEKVQSLIPIEKKLEKRMQAIFGEQKRVFLQEMERYRNRFVESLSQDDLDRIMASVSASTDSEMAKAIEAAGGDAIMAATEQRIAEVGFDIAFDLKNPRAVNYLSQNAALQVTNIDNTTRSRIATILTQGVDEGWSYDRTAKAIANEFEEFRFGRPQLHIQSRAHLVSVTESANAYEAGNKMVVDTMVEQGLMMEKKWLTVGDDLVSDECEANEAEGWIDSDAEHRSGHLHPPRFPGCRCDELYRRKAREL